MGEITDRQARDRYGTLDELFGRRGRAQLEGIAMAEKSGTFIVPTMQMTRVDTAMLEAGKLPTQAS